MDLDGEALAGLVEKAKEFGIRGKFVEKENFHINLKFFPDGEPEGIVRKLEGLKVGKFEIELDGLGHFGNRVLFVKAKSGKLMELQKEIEARLGGEGRQFSPHVTICRLKGKNDVNRFIRENRISVKGLMVEGVRLKESVLTPQGPIYSTIKEIMIW